MDKDAEEDKLRKEMARELFGSGEEEEEEEIHSSGSDLSAWSGSDEGSEDSREGEEAPECSPRSEVPGASPSNPLLFFRETFNSLMAYHENPAWL